jgi:hypothetical protein
LAITIGVAVIVAKTDALFGVDIDHIAVFSFLDQIRIIGQAASEAFPGFKVQG